MSFAFDAELEKNVKDAVSKDLSSPFLVKINLPRPILNRLNKFFNLIRIRIFFVSGLGLPFSTLRCSALLPNDPAAHQVLCRKCRIQTRDLCPRSLVHYQQATTSPCLTHHIILISISIRRSCCLTTMYLVPPPSTPTMGTATSSWKTTTSSRT